MGGGGRLKVIKGTVNVKVIKGTVNVMSTDPPLIDILESQQCPLNFKELFKIKMFIKELNFCHKL